MSQASSPNFIDGKTFDEFSQGLFTALINCSQASNSLPDSEDHKFYSTFPSYQLRISQVGENLLRLKQRFLDQNQSDSKIDNLDIDNEDLEELYKDRIVDCVDNILDKVDAYIDDCKGQVTKSTVLTQGFVARKELQIKRSTHSEMRVSRPQEQFLDLVDNTPGHFIPRIIVKPNAKVPLPKEIVSAQLSSSEIQSFKALKTSIAVYNAYKQRNNDANLGTSIYPHPYANELINLEYLPHQVSASKEQLYEPTTSFKWVDSLEELKSMIESLKGQKEIAVDLEHHAHRSYQGITCLMQISTRKEDFLIDTLVLMRHLSLLNVVFTDPSITKVLHGANSDVEWLQRDFGLYIVNLFDTGQAARFLEFESFGLAHLLQFFCAVTADKQYQTADWRIRPLSDVMKKYAQEDTHYLLYIYDRMKAQAIAKGNETNNLLMTILNRSRDLCLTVYDKPQLTPDAYLKTYEHCDGSLDHKQLAVYQALFAWRDRVGREMDESTFYVLPNRMMFNIAKNTPTSALSLLACCNPTPQLVRNFTNDLVVLIQESLTNPKPSLPVDRAIFSEQAVPEKKKLTYNPQASPSPLTTEQLYTRAGWIENSTASNSVVAVLSKKNEGYITNNPQQFSLFVSSHSSDEDSGDADDDIQIASKIRDNLLVPHKLNFDIPEKEDDEEEDIQEEIKLDAHIVTQPPPKPATPKQSAPLNSDNLMEIPQSMVEIYQLSNKNRKNKNKGKWRQKKEDKSEKKDAFEVVDEIHATKRNRGEDEKKEDEGANGMKKRKK